ILSRVDSPISTRDVWNLASISPGSPSRWCPRPTTCGGVVADAWGLTTIANLYAVGEVSMTGLHGANRLASNSLLEALVFSHQAAQAARETLPELLAKPATRVSAWNTYGAKDSEEGVVVSHSWDEIRRFMWNYVGIVRSDSRLLRAQARIDLVLKE